MKFDFRLFVGSSFDGTQQTISQVLQSMDSLQIDRALVCPMKPLSYDLAQTNLELAEAIRPHADRLAGAARVDPWQENAVELLRRAVEKLGLRALYLNPWEEHFQVDMVRLDPLMGAAQALRVPVLIAAGYPWLSEALQIKALADRWPNLPMVMSNGGQINISGLGQANATLALSQCANLYIDTAGVYRQDFLEETIEAMGAERVLFASGAPYLNQRYESLRVDHLKIDTQARALVEGQNALWLMSSR